MRALGFREHRVNITITPAVTALPVSHASSSHPPTATSHNNIEFDIISRPFNQSLLCGPVIHPMHCSLRRCVGDEANGGGVTYTCNDVACVGCPVSEGCLATFNTLIAAIQPPVELTFNTIDPTAYVVFAFAFGLRCVCTDGGVWVCVSGRGGWWWYAVERRNYSLLQLTSCSILDVRPVRVYHYHHRQCSHPRVVVAAADRPVRSSQRRARYSIRAQTVERVRLCTQTNITANVRMSTPDRTVRIRAAVVVAAADYHPPRQSVSCLVY